MNTIKHPFVGKFVDLKPRHFQLENEDFKEMNVEKSFFYGICKVHSVGADTGEPTEYDFFFFEKDGIVFPAAPINFFEVPFELTNLI